MVSSEEKRKCIENVIELSSNEETKSIALKNLYQVLSAILFVSQRHIERKVV